MQDNGGIHVKRIMMTAAAALTAFGVVQPVAMADTTASALYSDVTSGSYGATQILNLTTDGYIHGFSDGTFRPNAVVTRGQFLSYFMNEMKSFTHIGPLPKTKQYFSDVRPGNWLYPYVGAAMQAGWINPAWMHVSPGHSFGANSPVTRVDVAALFAAAMKSARRLQLPSHSTPLSYASNLGLFRGVSAQMNRASAAITLVNMLQWLQGTLLPAGDVPVVTSSGSTVNPNTLVYLHVSIKGGNGRTGTLPAPAKVSYKLSNTDGAFLLPSTGAVMMNKPGTYSITATVDGVESAPYLIKVIDQPTGVTLTAAKSVLLANGQQTDDFTATVVDSMGQSVKNFSGIATLMPLMHGTYVNPATGADITSVLFKNGVAQFAVRAGTTGGLSDTVSLTGLSQLSGQPVSASISYGSDTIDYSWSTDEPAAIQLSSAKSVIVADGQQTDLIKATIVDGYGQPVTQYTGTASLLPLIHGAYVDPTTGALITSVTFLHGVATFAIRAGNTGGVSDTVTLIDLTSANAQFQTQSAGINYGTLSIQYAWSNNQPAGIQLATSASGLQANGKQTDAITATVVNAFGQPVTNFSGSATLTPLLHGAYVDPETGDAITTVTFADGVAHFAVQAGTTGGVNDTLALSDLASANGQSVTSSVSYGTATIEYAWPGGNEISLQPALAFVSNLQATEDQVAATITDASGANITSGLPVYATFSLRGPGSFVQHGTPLSTVSEYVIPGVPTVLPVWSVLGQSGSIAVTASAAGYSQAQVNIQSVAEGSPSSLDITSISGTVSAVGAAQAPGVTAGTPFTLYTVGLVDKTGIPVIPAQDDSITVSDNSASVGGTIEYFDVVNGQPTGSAMTNTELQTFISSSTGQAQFAVVNTQAGTATPTISVVDSLGLTQTVQYSYTKGLAAYAMFPADTLANLSNALSYLESGQSTTYAVQLEDVNGNPLTSAGQSVDFYFSGKNAPQAIINGSSAWSATNPFVAVTNPQGQAMVSVTVPAGSVGAFTLSATVAGTSNASAQTVQIEPANLYTTQLVMASTSGGTSAMAWPTGAMSIGQTLSQFVGSANNGISSLYATPENYVGSYTRGNDQLEITTSNPDVLAITGNANWTEVNGLPFEYIGSSSAVLPTITAVKSGIVTLAIQDISNPSAPRITETINVTG